VASVADGADSVLYSANGNLFLSSSINNGPFKLTNVQNNTALYGLNTNNYNGVGANFTGGYVFLGPLIYQYGTFIQPAGISPSSGTVIFPIPFTSIPSINVLITPICKAGGSSVAHTVSLITGTITTTQFQWSYDTTTTAQVGLTWIATGI
jgi:hypothetical protein